MHKKLMDLGLAAVVVSFIGCGGGGGDTSTPNTSTPSTTPNISPSNAPVKGLPTYQEKLAQAPQIIQTAINANPVQYVDASLVRSLESANNSMSYACTITATPTKINDTTGYSFITTKTDNKVLFEGVYGWQNSIYSIAQRQISSDSSINYFDFLNNIAESPETKDQNLTPTILKAFATLLSLDTMNVTCNLQIRNNLAHFSNIICTTRSVTKNLSDFDTSNDDTIGFQSLIKICAKFSTE